MIPRFVYGFLFAPGIGLCLLALLNRLSYPGLPNDWSFPGNPILLTFAYGIALVLGIPTFVVFTRLGLRRWWHYAVGGFGLGLVMPVLLKLGALLRPLQLGDLEFAGECVTLGVLSALAFWLIAICRDEEAEV